MLHIELHTQLNDYKIIIIALIFKKRYFFLPFSFLLSSIISILPSFIPSFLSSLPSFSLPSFGQRPKSYRTQGNFCSSVSPSVFLSFCPPHDLSHAYSRLKSAPSDSGPLPCFLSFQCTIMQSRATGIAALTTHCP